MYAHVYEYWELADVKRVDLSLYQFVSYGTYTYHSVEIIYRLFFLYKVLNWNVINKYYNSKLKYFYLFFE